MKQYLQRLIAGETLSRQDTHDILVGITREVFPHEQVAALLMAMQTRGATVDEMLGFRDGLLETGKHIDLTAYDTLDIVGTGGDGKNTFNISTCACFVVAGAGFKVSKHGNGASTSVSGASNVLMGHLSSILVRLATRFMAPRTQPNCGFMPVCISESATIMA